MKLKRPASSAVVEAGDRDSKKVCSQNTGSVYVFPGLNPKKPMSNGTILVVLNRMGIRAG